MIDYHCEVESRCGCYARAAVKLSITCPAQQPSNSFMCSFPACTGHASALQYCPPCSLYPLIPSVNGRMNPNYAESAVCEPVGGGVVYRGNLLTLPELIMDPEARK